MFERSAVSSIDHDQTCAQLSLCLTLMQATRGCDADQIRARAPHAVMICRLKSSWTSSVSSTAQADIISAPARKGQTLRPSVSKCRASSFHPSVRGGETMMHDILTRLVQQAKNRGFLPIYFILLLKKSLNRRSFCDRALKGQQFVRCPAGGRREQGGQAWRIR